MKDLLKSVLRIMGLLAVSMVCLTGYLAIQNKLTARDILSFMQERYVQDEAGYVEELRKGMLARQACIRINYRGTLQEDMEKKALDMLEMVFETNEPDIPDDADYLEYTYQGVSAELISFFGIYQVTYHFDYLETQEETEYTGRQVEAILSELDIKDTDDYTKVKKIHDYIVKELDYDEGLSRATPYEALTTGKATCQGYATLFYRMAEEAGVPCRIIGGTADGQPHAWNIVKLDGLWYNIDCTWDDPVGKGVDKYKIRHEFFLKSDNRSFLMHIRDGKYQTSEFQKKYPMAKKDYVRN